MKYSYNHSRIKANFKTRLRKMKWKYPNLILLLLGIIFAKRIISSELIAVFINNLGLYGYVGSFITGFAFSYGITTAPAAAMLYTMGKFLNPVLIAITATSGAVLGDYLIFNYVKHRLVEEIKTASEELKINFSLKKMIMRHKILMKMIPVVAGFIIATPLPGELAAMLFASMNYDSKTFVRYAVVLNFFGISLIALLGT